jgi:DNA-binding CsgD family transcriptional regulator
VQPTVGSQSPHRSSSWWFLGFGLLWAVWFAARLSPSGWLTSTVHVADPSRYQVVLGFGTASYAAAFLVVILLGRRLSPLRDRRALLVGAGVVAGSGLALVALNGLAFLGVAGSVVAVSVSDVASAVLLLSWGELYGSVDLRKASIGISGSFVVGAGLYALLSWMGPVAPVLTAIFLACCPLLSLASLLAAWKVPGVRPLDAAVQRSAFRMPLTLMLGMAAAGFAIGFIVVLGISHQVPGAHVSSVVPGVSIGVIAIAALGYARFKRILDLRFLYWCVLLFLSAGFMLLPVAGYVYACRVATIGYAFLEICWTLLCAEITYRVPAPALACMASGALANYSGALAGGLTSGLLIGGYPLSTWELSVVSAVMVCLLLLSSALLLRETALPVLWGLSRETVPQSSQVPEGLVRTRCAKAAADHGLTPREQEVLVLLAGGRAPDDIGRELVISEATVRTHSKRLYEKLGVHSQPQLIKMVVFDLDVAESG